MTRVAFGVALPVRGSIDSLVASACEAEALGYDAVWVTDDRLQKDPFVVLAAIAQATTRVRLGPGVTNPYSRHAALIATAVAAFDELSGGRAVLGLGAGGTNHRALGIVREAPAAALGDAIELIRALLAGEEVTLEGSIVRAREARLDFEPPRAAIPIYVGTRGPRVLEVAGAKADGVIVGNVASPDGWSYATRRIAAGARRAGRDPRAVELVAWLYCSIGDVDAIRPMVATSLATSRPILHELGVTMPERYARAMDELGWSLEREAVERAGAEIPDDVLRFFSLAGTPDECAASLRELLDRFPQIAQVVIVPATNAASTLRRFMLEVVPLLAREPAGKPG